MGSPSPTTARRSAQHPLFGSPMKLALHPPTEQGEQSQTSTFPPQLLMFRVFLPPDPSLRLPLTLTRRTRVSGSQPAGSLWFPSEGRQLSAPLQPFTPAPRPGTKRGVRSLAVERRAATQPPCPKEEDFCSRET